MLYVYIYAHNLVHTYTFIIAYRRSGSSVAIIVTHRASNGGFILGAQFPRRLGLVEETTRRAEVVQEPPQRTATPEVQR